MVTWREPTACSGICRRVHAFSRFGPGADRYISKAVGPVVSSSKPQSIIFCSSSPSSWIFFHDGALLLSTLWVATKNRSVDEKALAPTSTKSMMTPSSTKVELRCGTSGIDKRSSADGPDLR